jgi:hypothetical protein
MPWAASRECVSMSRERQIWFKMSLGRYYPVHIYGWISVLSIIAATFIAYHFLMEMNQTVHFVSDGTVPFIVLVPGLGTLFYIIKKRS